MKVQTKLIALALSAGILGSAFTIMATSAIDHTPMEDKYIGQQDVNQNFVRTAAPVHAINTDFTQAAESTVNAVVSIKSFVTPRQQRQMNGFFDPFEFFFGPDFGQGQGQSQRQPQQQQPQQSGLGSGVIITDDGYIVTNNHVVEGAEKLEVTLNDNRSFNAKIIGTDAVTDLALLKIDVKGLSPIEFGNSDDVKIGEWVLAVGNPFGFTSTVTAGIVSAKARSISSTTNSRSMGIESFIQTDAAVNPGNSGGALVNTNGQLIGINTAIYSRTGNYEGYSFAIPSAIVIKVINDIKQYGTVQRAVLGISYGELTSDLAKDKNITAVNEGIYVGEVSDRSAAKEGGLQVGDVITEINGERIKNSGTMQAAMSKYRPGDKIKVKYYRDNKAHVTTITLKNNQGDTSIVKSSDIFDLGCTFREVKSDKLKELQINSGLEVIGVKDGKFKNAGIKNGFIILEINDQKVSKAEDVEKIYKSIMTDATAEKVMLIIGVYPTGKKMYYAVDLRD